MQKNYCVQDAKNRIVFGPTIHLDRAQSYAKERESKKTPLRLMVMAEVGQHNGGKNYGWVSYKAK